MKCGRILSYLLYSSVASLPSPSSNIEAWPYGTSLRFASLLHSGRFERSKKMLRRKKRWDSKENLPNVKFFLGDNIQNRQSTKILKWKIIMEFLKNRMRFKVFLVKHSFSLPKLLYFLRASTCSSHPPLVEKFEKP